MPKTTQDLGLKSSIHNFDAFVRCTLMGNHPWPQLQNGIRERSITCLATINALIFDLIHVGFVKLFQLFVFMPWLTVLLQQFYQYFTPGFRVFRCRSSCSLSPGSIMLSNCGSWCVIFCLKLDSCWMNVSARLKFQVEGRDRGGDTFNTASPYEQLLPFPPHILRCFRKDSLKIPTTQLQASFTATHPPHPPPLPS